MAHCGFIDLGVGARPLGMGHAFVGVANDVNAIYYNPAGLVNIVNMEFCFMYAPLMLGLSDGSAISDMYGAFAMKLSEESALGVAWLGRGLSGPGYSGIESLYNENTLYGSYSMWVTDKLLLGVSAKVPMHAYGEDEYTKNGVDNSGNVTVGENDPTFKRGYSKMGFSADAGILYQLSEALSLGVMLQNLLSSNIALDAAAARDAAPLYIKAGVGYKIPKLAIIENIIVASDIVYHAGGLNDIKSHSGFEGWLFGQTIAARAGFGVGTNSYMDFSCGGSYVIKMAPEMQIDYAWTVPLGGLKTAGNHRFSCTVRL